GKTFQSGASQSLKTPRRALGSVNQADRVAGFAPSQTGLKPALGTTPASVNKKVAAQFQKPSSVQKPKSLSEKSSKLNEQLFPSLDKENNVGGKSKQQGKPVSTSRPAQSKASTDTIDPKLLPDIEYMPEAEPPAESDDESIWPKRDRVSNYVDRILNWRPSCLFGIVPESEDEEEEERQRKRIMEELDNIPLPKDNDDDRLSKDLHLSFEELNLDAVPLPSIDDIVLLSEEAPENSGTAAVDVSLPSLDDSIGLSLHLGNLVLKDSLPNSPAH
ncbi:hypothetical protein BaRGS_00022863, partial [Batillaria attramentaria]